MSIQIGNKAIHEIVPTVLGSGEITNKFNSHSALYAALEDEWDVIYRMNIDYRIAMMQPYFREGNALELGTGGGHCTAELCKYFEHVESVEGSELLAERLRARGLLPNLKLHVSSFEDFKIQLKFDNIFLIQVLEHLDDPIDILRKYRDALNPGGRIYITVPNAQSIHRLAAVELGLLQSADSLNEIDIAAGHRRVYSPMTLTSDLHRAGLSVIHRGGLFVKPLSNTQIVRQWSEPMIRAFHDIAFALPDHAAEIVAVVEHRLTTTTS